MLFEGKCFKFYYEFFYGVFKEGLNTQQNGYMTLRRTTLRLLNHFVEKTFSRIVILSNVHFVDRVFRRILSTKYSMLTLPHILSADHFVRLRTLAEITNLKLTAVFYKGAHGGDERV